SSTVFPSIPGFPWFARTRFNAALRFSPHPGRFGPFRFAPGSFTPLGEREGQLFLLFLPHFTHEIRYLLTTPIVQAFAPSPELLCPLLTSALRSGRLSVPSVTLSATQDRPPGVIPAAFH